MLPFGSVRYLVAEIGFSALKKRIMDIEKRFV